MVAPIQLIRVELRLRTFLDIFPVKDVFSLVRHSYKTLKHTQLLPCVKAYVYSKTNTESDYLSLSKVATVE